MEPVGSDQHAQFCTDMADLTERELQRGLDATRDFTGFFTFPAFREACKTPPDAHGLPSAHEAYMEACMAQSKPERHEWSHPAVYHAGVATGWFELRSFTEGKIFPRFRRCYEELCKRVADGEDLTLPVRQAITDGASGRPCTKEEGKQRVAELKKTLGF